MSKPNFRPAGLPDQAILKGVQVRLCAPQERERYAQLMISHHYLKSDQLVGEQIRYVAEVEGAWVGLLSWSAAAFHLEHREQWIGWSYEQRRRRLALVANNSRLLLLPGVDCTNLAFPKPSRPWRTRSSPRPRSPARKSTTCGICAAS